MLHRTIALFPLIAALAALAAPACSSTDPACHVGADCASGACDSSGHCVSGPGASSSGGTIGADAQVGDAPSGGSSGSSGGGDDGSGSSSGGSSGGGSGGSSGGLGGDGGLCTPNGDGVITRQEVPMMAGLHANFMIAENVTMNTAGTTQPSGLRVWDFTASLSGDHKVLVTTDAPTGQWFSPQFTTATYTTKLSDTQTLLGVFQASSSALLLQGVVSPTSGAQQTELSYSPPANTLAVPLQVGTSWTSTSTVTGPAEGVPSDYTEMYSSKVDVRGTLKLPYGDFDVLRIETTLTRTIGATVTVIRSLNFVTECFGPVATLTSQIDETSAEFTNVAEARRLTP